MVDLDKVLKKLNQGRKGLGLQPLVTIPKGEIGDCGNCPVALALESAVGYCTVSMMTKEKEAKLFKAWRRKAPYLPKIVTQFIHEFDDKKHPELIK